MQISAIMRKRAGIYPCLTGALPAYVIPFMRISFIIIFMAITSVQILAAKGTRAQDLHTDRVQVGLYNQKLEIALQQIERQTKLRFFYHETDLKGMPLLTLPKADRTVEATLQIILANTFVSFRQVAGGVILERKGEDNFEVTGRIIDTQHQPVVSATVNLEDAAKGTLLLATKTDTGGHFKLIVKEKGNYLLNISFVGMGPLTVSLTLQDIRVIMLPDLILPTAPTTLGEVKIIARKPVIEQQIDRTVVNVDAMLSNAGANAIEVLEKSPGIIVDQNGSITFKGKSGVTILVDGKPTYLSGENLANFLKSLPASQLEQIELMPNPPAKYDAAGNAGLINIKTKKNKAPGLNGTLTANLSQANFTRYGGNLNLNYRGEKANIFGSLGYNTGKQYNSIRLQRNYFDIKDNPTSVYKEFATLQPDTRNTSIKLGADLNMSSKTTLGAVYTGSFSKIFRYNPVTSQLLDGQDKLDSTILAENYRQAHFNSQGVNLNYSHSFDKTGRALNIDADYLNYNILSDDQFNNKTYLPDGNLFGIQQVIDHLPTDINIYSGKADYTQPLKNGIKLEAGIKSSYVNTDNTASYFNVESGQRVADNDKTNRFLYRENINAAYLNLGKDCKRFSLQAGLRIENTNANGHQMGNAIKPDSSFNNHYTDFFPTAYALYKLDTAGRHTLTASFGRRIDRPYYQDLNPFVTIIDKYTWFSGNPFLKPQHVYNYELDYSYRSWLTATFFWNNYRDFQNETVAESNGIFISRTSNIGQKVTKGLSITATLNPLNWWDCNLYTEVVNFLYRGQVYASALNTGSTYFYIQAANQFRLSNGWSAELSGFYFTGRVVGQFRLDPKSQVNAGIQKRILKDKGAIRLTARDIFLDNISSGYITNIPGITSVYKNVFDSRMVLLGFSYSLGQSGKALKNKTSAEDEQNRVKQ